MADFTPIKSSAIKGHAYDPDTRKMRVQLHNGKIYEYDDVPAEKFAAFTGNQSPGAFWNTKIKGAHIGREITDGKRKDGFKRTTR